MTSLHANDIAINCTSGVCHFKECFERDFPGGPTVKTLHSQGRESDSVPGQGTGGFPGGSDGKESACNVGDLGSIPGWGRSPGGRHGNSLQYPCLENPMDRGVSWATVHGVAKSQDRTEQLILSLSLYTCKIFIASLLKLEKYPWWLRQ